MERPSRHRSSASGPHRARPRSSRPAPRPRDRKSTRLNSSHLVISYAVFCLKKKKNQTDSTSQETGKNQNDAQLSDENAHNDNSVHGVLNPTYHGRLLRDAVEPDTAARREQR